AEARGLAYDLEPVPRGKDEAAIEARDHVVRTAEGCGEADIDAALAHHLLGRDPLGLACEQANRVHAVGPDVHKRAPVELRAEAGVAGAVNCRELEAERGADNVQLPKRALANERRDLL